MPNINGRVTDSSTGNGISGATVTSTASVSVNTDSNGYYTKDHIAGNFSVQATASGYYSSGWVPVTVPPGTTNFPLVKKPPLP